MKIAALVSGGKDSIYAAYLASMRHEIKYIISIISENPESYMFHVPNAGLVAKQAEAMGIPLIQKTTKGEKEEELEDLRLVLKETIGIEGVVSGAFASNYQRDRIDNICRDINLKSLAPLWHRDPLELLRGMISKGFEIIITAVAAPPLDESWLGRKIDERCLEELIKLNKEYEISVMGEGGEFESFVLDCPLFRKKLILLEAKRQWEEKTRSGWLEIKNLGFIDK
jgi:diphthine-ammonia ligase